MGARGLYSAPEIAGQAATIRHLPAARLPGHGRGLGPPAPFTSGRGPGMNLISPSAGRGLDAAAVGQAVAAPPQETRKRPRLAPLLGLQRYALRYRWQVVGALAALLVAAAATLAVPLAVRRMIDFGFSAASAARYYLVTIIGERVVADLRSDLFAHVTNLSAAFFDTAKTGEVMSRLTADTTQIKATVGASVSIALRNLMLFLGAAVMMVVT